jgi:hypothetical protein
MRDDEVVTYPIDDVLAAFEELWRRLGDEVDQAAW